MKAKLEKRANLQCELCSNPDHLEIYELPDDNNISKYDLDFNLLLCHECFGTLKNLEDVGENDLKFLNDSIWSEHKPVQALSYSLLHRIKDSHSWSRELLENVYLDDDMIKWAHSCIKEHILEELPKDSNNNILNNGDSVSIIKDLEVKGAGFTAKRGTIVKNISLNGNIEQVEGRVNGTKIVLLSKFLKKI
jgi:protein PhnA